jgi:hypothetical protein
VEDMFELMEAVDNLLISKAMGWDMDGAIERLRVAKARVDINGTEETSEPYGERMLPGAPGPRLDP